MPATEFVTVDVEGLRISLFVCYDLRFADEFWQLALDTDVYLVPANWPEKRRVPWMALLQARAIENQAYVVGVNRVGTADERPSRTAATRASSTRSASCWPPPAHRVDPAGRHLHRPRRRRATHFRFLQDRR